MPLLNLRDFLPDRILSYACALIILALCLRQIHLWFRLRHIPGPPCASWTVGWQLAGALSGSYHEWLNEAVDKYGPLIRIGPNELLSTDPDVWRYMSAIRSPYTKGPFYDAARFVPDVDNVASLRDEAKHKVLRGKIAPAYSKRENGTYSFEPGLNRQLMNFINLLDRKYISTATDTRPVDLAEKIQFFALDAIGDVSLGEPFGFLNKDVDLYSFNEINASSLPVVNIVAILPVLSRMIYKWPLRLFLPSEGDKAGFGRLMNFAQNFVRKRLDPQTAPIKDMMQAHIDSGMTEEELIQQVFVSIIAGSGTTAHVLQMAILSLISNPTVYTALQNEVRQASGVSTPISWAQTQTLPYLQAVVRESLRLWHPFCALASKRVPPEGDYINGFWVPGGTDVGHGFNAIGRSKAVWGEDASVFRPERWLHAQEDQLKTMIAAVDTQFGAGKYSCLGRPIALMELHKTIFELIKRYDFSVINTERPMKITTSVLVLASEFWVRVTKRI